MELARAREEIETIFAAVLRRVDPEALVRDALAVAGDSVVINGTPYRVPATGRVLVVAIGKAAVPMVRGAYAALGDRLDGGLAVTKASETADIPDAIGPVRVTQGSHPVPDATSVAAGRQLLETVAQLTADDLVLALISGGGSALVEAPVAGISLEAIAQTTDLLLRAGADIGALNAVRRRLSRIKGGGLARALAPARAVNLIISDVLGNPLPVIASGPTIVAGFDRDPVATARQFGIWEELPEPVRVALAEQPPELDQTVDPVLETIILADAATAAHAAAEAAAGLGYQPAVLATRFEGEAREFAGFWAELAREARTGNSPFTAPACLIGAGELTVTVRGSGRGGRNTEMALAAALAIADLQGVAIASLATDGDDGVSEAAGGVVVGDSIRRARAAGLDPAALLAENDSARVLAAAGGLIVTGPTGTNVNDLYFALIP